MAVQNKLMKLNHLLYVFQINNLKMMYVHYTIPSMSSEMFKQWKP